MVFSTTKTRKVRINSVLRVSHLYFISKATASHSEGDSKGTMIPHVRLSFPRLLLSPFPTVPPSLSLLPFPLPDFHPFPFLTLVYVDKELGAGLPGTSSAMPPAAHWLSSLSITRDWIGGHAPTGSRGLSPVTAVAVGRASQGGLISTSLLMATVFGACF